MVWGGGGVIWSTGQNSRSGCKHSQLADLMGLNKSHALLYWTSGEDHQCLFRRPNQRPLPSKLSGKEDSFEHSEIILKPLNPKFAPIKLDKTAAEEYVVVGELVRIA